MVANWREKIWRVFGLTFLKTFRALSSPEAASSSRLLASRPRTRELLPGPCQIGRVELALSSARPLIAEYENAATVVPRKGYRQGVQGLKRDADS